MGKKQLFHVFVGVLCLSVSLHQPHVTAAAVTSSTQPDNWHAHAPIHVRGDMTTAPAGYAPAQIRHAYGVDRLSADGTGQILGIVDAFDDPTAASDLQTFITAFGLPRMNGLPGTPACTVAAGPHPCFQTVYAQGKPSTNANWLLETALDVEWSHAIAPGADILLVEARSDGFTDLLGAADRAVNDGARTVSMSWGGPEFSGEAHYDAHFQHAGVTFAASAGDSGTGVTYPAASPYVVAVGGTTLPLDSSGNLAGPESAWSGSGGGLSAYESAPGYQSTYPIPAGAGKRSVPDVAYDADPRTGASVYASNPSTGQGGWFAVGGTSVGAPQWAALIALADQERAGRAISSTSLASAPVYNAAAATVYASNYRDITAGSNGLCGSMCTASAGYDFVTGMGSPLANSLVSYLGTH